MSARCVAGVVAAAVVAVVAVVTFGGAVASGPSAASAAPLDSADARDQILAGLEADATANPTIPGEAVAVPRAGLNVSAATGLADVGTGEPLQLETPFRVASVTKTFVAVRDPATRGTGGKSASTPRSCGTSRGSRLRCCGPAATSPRASRFASCCAHTAGLYDYAEDPAYDANIVSDPTHRLDTHRAASVRHAAR